MHCDKEEIKLVDRGYTVKVFGPDGYFEARRGREQWVNSGVSVDNVRYVVWNNRDEITLESHATLEAIGLHLRVAANMVGLKGRITVKVSAGVNYYASNDDPDNIERAYAAMIQDRGNTEPNATWAFPIVHRILDVALAGSVKVSFPGWMFTVEMPEGEIVCSVGKEKFTRTRYGHSMGYERVYIPERWFTCEWNEMLDAINEVTNGDLHSYLRHNAVTLVYRKSDGSLGVEIAGWSY